MTLDPSTRTRLEKAASDNGFDLLQGEENDLLGFASSHATLKIWLTALGPESFVVAMSDDDIDKNLHEFGAVATVTLPPAAKTARTVAEIKDLYPLLRRAFQLSRSLPDAPLREYRRMTHELPIVTDAERTVIQRVGQNIFRERLMEYWDSKCAVTGLAIPELLKASHIKPWKDSTDEERLDIFNGLLLAPHLDAAFDRGFITIDDSGLIIISPALTDTARTILGISATLKINHLTPNHHHYLPWHREKVFMRKAGGL